MIKNGLGLEGERGVAIQTNHIHTYMHRKKEDRTSVHGKRERRIHVSCEVSDCISPSPTYTKKQKENKYIGRPELSDEEEREEIVEGEEEKVMA